MAEKRLPTGKGGLLDTLNEPSGLIAAGVTAGLCLLLSLALWVPLGWPSTAIRSAVPALSCGTAPALVGFACRLEVALRPFIGSLALAAVAFVFRKSLAAGVTSLRRRVPQAGALLAAAMATIVFILSWAGSHVGRSLEFGLLPQIVFPALTGVVTYAIGRWGPAAHTALRAYFDARDHLSMKLRLVAMMAIPTLLSFWLTARTGAGRAAFNEQFVVVVGLVLGFLVVQPRRGPKGPG